MCARGCFSVISLVLKTEEHVVPPSTSLAAAPADTGRALTALPASAVCSCAFIPHAPSWPSFKIMPPAGTSGSGREGKVAVGALHPAPAGPGQEPRRNLPLRQGRLWRHFVMGLRPTPARGGEPVFPGGWADGDGMEDME
jgi:hypothetical protein